MSVRNDVSDNSMFVFQFADSTEWTFPLTLLEEEVNTPQLWCQRTICSVTSMKLFRPDHSFSRFNVSITILPGKTLIIWKRQIYYGRQSPDQDQWGRAMEHENLLKNMRIMGPKTCNLTFGRIDHKCIRRRFCNSRSNGRLSFRFWFVMSIWKRELTRTRSTAAYLSESFELFRLPNFPKTWDPQPKCFSSEIMHAKFGFLVIKPSNGGFWIRCVGLLDTCWSERWVSREYNRKNTSNRLSEV